MLQRIHGSFKLSIVIYITLFLFFAIFAVVCMYAVDIIFYYFLTFVYDIKIKLKLITTY
jgi:hypothetical protein